MIIRLRETRGLSQAAAARRVGIGRSDVHNWEHGRSRPSVQRLWHYLSALEATPAETVAVLAELAGDSSDATSEAA